MLTACSIILLAVFQVVIATTNSTSDEGSKSYQRLALELHNEFRAVHQAAPLKPSEDLNVLAAQCAKHYAVQGFCDTDCPFRPNNTEQSCYWEWKIVQNDEIQFVRNSIEAWSGEECKYDYTKEGQPETRNFSLMVWGSSQELGFGIKRFGILSFSCALYRPAGNIVGQFQNNVFRPINSTFVSKCN